MGIEAFVRLADALDRLPNGFPRTESGVELEVLKWMFTPEEAKIASILGREMESYIDISEKIDDFIEAWGRFVFGSMHSRDMKEIICLRFSSTICFLCSVVNCKVPFLRITPAISRGSVVPKTCFSVSSDAFVPFPASVKIVSVARTWETGMVFPSR